jgi:glycosyltransferase involved in cell wall biosynthesis
MRVTHFVENLNRGGLERVVIDLIAAQRAMGHACEVICLFERGALAAELGDSGVQVRACGKRAGVDLGALRRARRLLRDAAPDVLHTHNMAAHYHAVAAGLGLPIRRIVNTRHGMGSVARLGRRDWLYARTMRRTHAVVAVCEAARRDLIARSRLPAARLVVVPNGIRVERFQPASDEARRNLLSSLGFAATARPVGFVGRLNWAKDLGTLIRAFASVRNAQPDAVLVLVGDGEARGELEAQARASKAGDAIRFVGDRADVNALLAGFELFALSSITEGYSIALLEACGAALPIVATDVGGNAEIVRDGVNGRIVAAREPDALAAAVIALLAAPADARAMGLAGRRWVLESGSFEAMARAYERVYEGR